MINILTFGSQLSSDTLTGLYITQSIVDMPSAICLMIAYYLRLRIMLNAAREVNMFPKFLHILATALLVVPITYPTVRLPLYTPPTLPLPLRPSVPPSLCLFLHPCSSPLAILCPSTPHPPPLFPSTPPSLRPPPFTLHPLSLHPTPSVPHLPCHCAPFTSLLRLMYLG
jgi:hypothetical protein